MRQLPERPLRSDERIPAEMELIAVTHNETSMGVSLPLEYIHSLKAANPQALIVVDAVSSLPFPDFDYSTIDSAFFSVQKGFGLPAGLGVWMVNERCINVAEERLAKGASLGSYHTIPSLKAHAAKFQTPETPNVLAVFLLSKVIGDMLRVGIKRIRTETEYKAAILYKALQEHRYIEPVCHGERYSIENRNCSTNGRTYGKHHQATSLRAAFIPVTAMEVQKQRNSVSPISQPIPKNIMNSW